MPVKIQSVGKGKYRVSTPRGTKAKHTTKAKAEKQKRLLNAIDHGFKPTGRPAKKKTRTESLALKVVQTLLENEPEPLPQRRSMVNQVLRGDPFDDDFDTEKKLSRFLLDEIDSDYDFYSRVSNFLCGRVLRDEEAWESTRSGEELVDELYSKSDITKIQSLFREIGQPPLLGDDEDNND